MSRASWWTAIFEDFTCCSFANNLQASRPTPSRRAAQVTVVDRIFQNRREAGAILGQRLLSEYGDRSDIVVLAIPRGGVPVGFEIAQALHATLDVLVVRKLGVPGHEELAMGAIATGEVTVVNREVVQALSIPETELLRVKALEQLELNRRELAYRGSGAPLPVHGKIVIIVDDGLATGSTMRAAVMATRQREPAKVVVGSPRLVDRSL